MAPQRTIDTPISGQNSRVASAVKYHANLPVENSIPAQSAGATLTMVRTDGGTRHRGRPTRFEQALEMTKMTWSPVLAILGTEAYARMDQSGYQARPLQFKIGDALIASELDRGTGTIQRWLSAEEVVRIHDEMIATFGGSTGTLDVGKVRSALDRAQFSKVYDLDPSPTVLHKAASLMHDILLYHPFADGQKRTGLSSAFIFLGLNGYTLWSRNVMDEVHFAIRVAKGDHSVEEVTHWLADRVAPPSQAGPSQIEMLLRMSRPERRRCHTCRSYLPIRQYFIRCRRCGSKYTVAIRFAAEAHPAAGPEKVVATVGLERDWSSDPEWLLQRSNLGGMTLRRRLRAGVPPRSFEELVWRRRFVRSGRGTRSST
jgi:death on curing protein